MNKKKEENKIFFETPLSEMTSNINLVPDVYFLSVLISLYMSIDIFLRKIWNQNMQWRYLHANYSSSAASYLNTEERWCSDMDAL